jgi:AraC family transcriptional regulator
MAQCMSAVSASMQGGTVSSEVGALISRAALLFDADLCSARDCIMRAAAMLRAQRMAQGVQSRTSAEASDRGKLAQWQLKRVLGYIDANLESRIRTEDLARLARLSTSHFTRSFKTTLAAAPSSYVISRRLERACALMANTADELRAIASSCGMADQSHFCKVFRRVFGVTPRDWRRAHTNSAAVPPVA